MAISDELGLFAHPLTTLAPGPGLAGEIVNLAEREKAEAAVLGLPLRTDGRAGPAAEAALALKAEITDRGLTVHLIDERHTTAEAERRLIEQGRRRRSRRGSIDQAAACLILQAFLDRHRDRSPGEDSP